LADLLREENNVPSAEHVQALTLSCEK